MKHMTDNKIMLGKRFMHDKNRNNPGMSSIALESKRRVDEKIRSGVYRYESNPCYCGNADDILLAERDWFGSYYPFVMCKRCGIGRADPRMTIEAYIDFYAHEYRALYGDNDRKKEELYGARIKQAQEVYDFINRHIRLPENAVVFDIGCNMGTMLLPFYNNGHRVMGVDYGIEYIEFGRQRTGLRLEVGGTEMLRNFGEKADLVILNHVFEHFFDIDKELRKIRELLKPSAYVYISVPGTSWWITHRCSGNTLALLQNAHIWQFSPETLKYVMECNGFQPMFGNEEVVAIYKNVESIRRERRDIPQGEYERILKCLIGTERKYLLKLPIIKSLEMLGARKIKDLFIRGRKAGD